MNPQAWGNLAPGLFSIDESFFCLVIPQKTSWQKARFPVGTLDLTQFP
jgi:hypothetical protein